jgi:multiple sugar transport system substrate-binding protein
MKQHRLNRRDFLRQSAMAAGVLGLAACAPAAVAPAGETGGEAPAEEGITIAFVCDTINEGHTAVRQKWADDFTAETPGVTVEHQTVPWSDYFTKIQTLFAAGTPPDMYRYLQEIAPIITVDAKKLHVPLDDYIEADAYDISDFRPDAIELYRWNGTTYALPRDYGNQNLYYNVDLFEAEGVDPPPPDWNDTEFTFEVFLDMVQRLTKKDGDRTTQWGFLVNRGQRPWASWVYSNGGGLVHIDDRGVAYESAMADPEVVEATQFLQDLIYTHEVAPRPDVESELGGVDLFATGRVAVMLTNPSAVNQFRAIEAFTWDVGTIPIGKADRRGTGGGGTGWAIGNGVENPDVDWQFMMHITSEQAQLDEVSVGATTPSRVAVVTSEAFLSPDLLPEHSEAFAQAQEFVVRDPVNINWPEITQRVYNPSMDLLWSGAESAEAVGQKIVEESAELFATGTGD